MRAFQPDTLISLTIDSISPIAEAVSYRMRPRMGSEVGTIGFALPLAPAHAVTILAMFDTWQGENAILSSNPQ